MKNCYNKSSTNVLLFQKIVSLNKFVWYKLNVLSSVNFHEMKESSLDKTNL